MSGSERGLRASRPKVNDAVFDVGEPKRNGGDFLTSIAGSMGGASWNGSSATPIGVLVEGPAVETSNARALSTNRFEVAEGDVVKKASGLIVGFSVAILSKTNFHCSFGTSHVGGTTSGLAIVASSAVVGVGVVSGPRARGFGFNTLNVVRLPPGSR